MEFRLVAFSFETLLHYHADFVAEAEWAALLVAFSFSFLLLWEMLLVLAVLGFLPSAGNHAMGFLLVNPSPCF